jgi:hypothetical protein
MQHPEKPNSKHENKIKLCEICNNNNYKDLNQSENDNKEFRRSKNREKQKRHRSMLYKVYKEATRGREFW